MRVLIITTQLQPILTGGIGTYVMELSNGLIKNNVKVTVLVYNRKIRTKLLKQGKLKIFFYQAEYPHNTEYSFYKDIELCFKNFIKRVKEHFDIIHYNHVPILFPLAKLLLNYYKTPLITSLHSLALYDFLKGNLKAGLNIIFNKREMDRRIKYSFFSEKSVINCSDIIIHCSKSMKKYSENFYGNQKSVYIYPGISLDHFTEYPQDELFKFKKTFCNLRKKIVLFVGRVVEQKGVDYLLASIPHVIKINSNYHFLIVGKGNHDFYLSKIKGLYKHVTFTGPLEYDEVNMLYNIAYIGVMPSICEPFGLVALEMMRNRLPLLTTTADGLNEIIEDGKDGIKIKVYEDKNGKKFIKQKEFNNKLILLLLDSKLRKRIAYNAYKKVTKHFNANNFTRNILTIYNKVSKK